MATTHTNTHTATPKWFCASVGLPEDEEDKDTGCRPQQGLSSGSIWSPELSRIIFSPQILIEQLECFYFVLF